MAEQTMNGVQFAEKDLRGGFDFGVNPFHTNIPQTRAINFYLLPILIRLHRAPKTWNKP